MLIVWLVVRLMRLGFRHLTLDLNHVVVPVVLVVAKATMLLLALAIVVIATTLVV